MCAHMLKMNAPQAECFRSVVFHIVHGHVEVKAADYKLMSVIDPRAMWVKTCIIVSRYMLTMLEKFPSGHVAMNSSFEGRKAAVCAQKIKQSTVTELAADLATCKELEAAVKTLLGRYRVTNSDSDKIMIARGSLLSMIGKLSLKVGAALDQASIKARSMGKTFSSLDRKGVSATAMKGELAAIEGKYKESLAIAMGVQVSDMPDNFYRDTQKDATISTDQPNNQPADHAVSVAGLISNSGGGIDTELVTITENIVMARLNISKLPARVALANLDFIAREDSGISSQVYL